ncbi:hypothetical protein Ccrd_003172, partial [Cynara cardunculus var. scolymus]
MNNIVCIIRFSLIHERSMYIFNVATRHGSSQCLFSVRIKIKNLSSMFITFLERGNRHDHVGSYGITSAPSNAMASPVAPRPPSFGMNIPFSTSAAGGFT